MKENISKQFDESLAIMEAIKKDDSFLDHLEQMARIMVAVLRNDGAIYLAGNGGSAADAQHIAAELSGRFEIDRPPLNAEALHVNTSYLTAVANDYDFSRVYSRLVRAKGRKGDILIAISTSGNSENIIEAARAARGLQMTVLGMTGRAGGKLLDVSDMVLKVPSDNTARIQEIHIMIGHWLCKIIEQELFGDGLIYEEE